MNLLSYSIKLSVAEILILGNVRIKLNIIASKKVIKFCKYFIKRKGGGAMAQAVP
jgi:hypothetical protein